MNCRHCGEISKEEFCCLGCRAAYGIVNKLGFSSYYNLREKNFAAGALKPETDENLDITSFIHKEKTDTNSVLLMVQGMHCAACIWLIESILQKQENVVSARINLTKKTLLLRWRGDAQAGNALLHLIHEIGYKLLPFDQEILDSAERKYSDSILRALAVAGFGAGNIMLFSFSLWFADVGQMGVATRNLLHFFSSLIALPVIVFSARPFFSSAFRSIKSGYPNMDLAISIAIFLACVVSLLETFRSANHVYFDSAVMLVFFLLIGRYLDLRARKKAFAVATEFALLAASFGRVDDGKIKILPSKQLREGMVLLVAVGEKIAADGVVITGESEIDTSLITGETLPKKVAPNAEVFAGMINLAQPLRVRISKSPEHSLLTDIIRISQEAESKKGHYVRLADYLSRFYTPAVHLLAFVTFCFWFKSGWEVALMNATAVLIITCPCALALAVPIVQTITISGFVKKGILVKSGEALEKLAATDIVVFDKTGSLTLGAPKLVRIERSNNPPLEGGSRSEATRGGVTPHRLATGSSTPPQGGSDPVLRLAASLARHSKHPIAQALVAANQEKLEELKVLEAQGFGLEAEFAGKIVRLGRKEFCGVKIDVGNNQNLLTCFFKYGDVEAVFFFADEIKSDAKQVVERLHGLGKKVVMLSGDSKITVEETARDLGITEFYFEQTPVSKVKILEGLGKFVMVGDGINDAPALAYAYVSISFSRAADISQNIADVVIQGEKLSPILELFNYSQE
ncbi:MAG: heavy metal translocating P-type ATPase, partial [Alphaproteobacteria bacterium]|nr:heavy metal translocating P-type ATPase [Alphaproteobacteria bacterium]